MQGTSNTEMEEDSLMQEMPDDNAFYDLRLLGS
jgi:hypothetical protein